MIRVAVVEDSPVVREFLIHVISSDPDLKVVGVATNGEEALEMVQRQKPDVVTMDIHMPKMDGFEATRRIMETRPTPIVVVSGSSRARDVAFSFKAVEAGALTVIGRPAGLDDLKSKAAVSDLIQTIKLMAEIKVVRRWARRQAGAKAEPLPPPLAARPDAERGGAEIRVIAIGASTGGPNALRSILSELPKEFPTPLLIVQHVVPGFVPGLVEWLAGSSKLQVRIAAEGDYPLAGHAYVAPDYAQMTIEAGIRIRITPERATHGICPSVGCLFESVAETLGANAAGVLLTGMGTDGARELRIMRDRNAVTIAQDAESSEIHGMPGEAIRLDAATYVLPLCRIAPALINLAR